MDSMSTDPNADAPIRRRKLSSEVRQRLLAMLDEGDFAPGDVFPSERELMTRFDVGRPAVREAMQSLEATGLLQVRHGERPRVATPTMAAALERMGLTMRHALSHSAPTMEDLKEVRTATEGYLARIAARRHSAEEIAKLRAIVAAQADCAGTDPPAFMRLDGQFHAAVAAIAGNPVFALVVEALFQWLSEFHISAVHRPGLERLTVREHREIIDAIESGRGSRAQRAMTDHLERANDLYDLSNRHGGSAPAP